MLYMDKNYTILFTLLRAALHNKYEAIPNCADWETVFLLASKHGVAPIAWDGLNKLYEHQCIALDAFPNFKIKMRWIASVLFTERNQKIQEEALKSLDSQLEQNGIRMLLFKGLSVGSYYPNPSHRYSCDIDVYALDGSLKVLEQCIVNDGGRLGDKNRKHSTADYKSVHFELHNAFVYRCCSRKIARINDDLVHRLKDAQNLLDFKYIYRPSLEFETLFVLLHAASHYKTEGIAIRHIIDFALLEKKQNFELDEVWLSKNGLIDFARLLNKFSRDFLGFDTPEEKCICNASIYNRVFDDILNPAILNSSNCESKVKLLKKKYDRFTSRKWVYPIVGDNFWYAIWGSIMNHIIEPVSIFRGSK